MSDSLLPTGELGLSTRLPLLPLAPPPPPPPLDSNVLPSTVGVDALSAVSPATAGAGDGGPSRLTAQQLEVAVLDRRRPKRAFRRVVGAALHTLLGDGQTGETEAPPPGHVPSHPAPGTPAGLGDPAAPDTAGGTPDTGEGHPQRDG